MRKKILFMLLIAFTSLGVVFATEIIATFNIGGEFILDAPCGKIGTEILIINDSGLSISIGANVLFNIGEGLWVDPVIGIGYIKSFNNFFIGGIVNIIAKPYVYYNIGSTLYLGDVFIAPKLTGGYKISNNIVLGGELQPMYGFMSSAFGFAFSGFVGISF